MAPSWHRREGLPFTELYGVPDTVNGRLEMIMLHAVLVLRRLADAAGGGRDLGQELFDRFCRDMDDNMREMGVETSPCRGKCAGSERRSTAVKRPMELRSR